MRSGLINANPVVYKKDRRVQKTVRNDADEYGVEHIDQLEIFDHLRGIKDPEHPYTLEELKVITEDAIEDHLHSYCSALLFCTSNWTVLARQTDAVPAFAL